MCLWSRMLHLKDHQPDITLSAGRPKSSCKRRHNHIWCLSGGCPAGCILPFPSPAVKPGFLVNRFRKSTPQSWQLKMGRKKKGARRKGSDLLRQLCGLRPLSDWTSLSHGWKFGPASPDLRSWEVELFRFFQESQNQPGTAIPIRSRPVTPLHQPTNTSSSGLTAPQHHQQQCRLKEWSI